MKFNMANTLLLMFHNKLWSELTSSATANAYTPQKRAFIPGQSCGIQIPYRVLDKLTKDDVIEELECAIVLDQNSFEEFYTATTVGKTIQDMVKHTFIVFKCKTSNYCLYRNMVWIAGINANMRSRV